MTDGVSGEADSRSCFCGEKPPAIIVFWAWAVSLAVTAAKTRNRKSFVSSSLLTFSLWNEVKIIVPRSKSALTKRRYNAGATPVICAI